MEKLLKNLAFNFMPHTNYKQMIEELNEELILARFGFTEANETRLKNLWKSQAIKSLNNEIEYLESKKSKYQSVSEFYSGYNLAIKDHISHLLLEKSRINEEE